MDLFTYLMAKKGQNTGRDLFSYLLGKGAGGGGTYTTFTGISLNISNSVFGATKNFMLNSTDLTQDGTPTPSSPVDVNVIKGENNIKITNGTEEQNYPISLGTLEYCKIGNYADQIFKNTTDSPFYDNTLIENEWYLKENIRRLELNIADMNNSEEYPGWNNVTQIKSDYPNKNASLNALTSWKSNLSVENEGVGINTGGSLQILHLRTSIFNMTQTQWKTNYPNLKLILYYGLQTPTYTQISQTDYPILRSQLEDIYNNSKSYDGQTNITQTNDDLPFNISVDVLVGDE